MKEHALWLYRQLTAPSRRRLLAELREAGRVPIGVLFYHRVADQHPNSWTLSRSDFARQLDWLQSHCEVVSLAEAQRRIRSSNWERPTISLTFDDGYSENADYAIPELLRRGLTATYFVSTDFVRTRHGFPHDIAAGTYLSPNTVDQLREFAAQGIEIGAHTRSHSNLGSIHDPVTLESEILGSARDLESWLERRVRYFAFPFGLPENTSQAAVDLILRHGFDGFCTAYGAWNWPNSGGYHLRRIHADPGLEKLCNWLSFDVRKLHERVQLPFDETALTTSQRPTPHDQAVSGFNTNHNLLPFSYEFWPTLPFSGQSQL
jgi:peptidoglycan/xylan/chitin deacetylase (PgdA/CDA1 family)